MSPKLLNILLIIIPITLYFGVFDPLYNGSPGLVWQPEASIFELKSKNIQYTNALNQIDFIQKEVSNRQKNYANIPESEKAKMKTLLPDKLEALRLRNEVVDIANKAGVALTGLTVTNDIKNTISGLGSYTISFTVRVRYPIFKKLMEGYEKSQRMYMIEKLSIKLYERTEKERNENTNQIDDKETLDISVTFKVYYIK